MTDKKYLSLIIKLKDQAIDQRGINQLILLSSRIAYSFLKSKKKNHFIIPDQASSIMDIAIDAVTPLFLKNNRTGLLGLQTSLLNWNTTLETEEQAQFFLHKVVWNRIEQHLSGLLKEADPVFARILKTLYYHINENEIGRAHV